MRLPILTPPPPSPPQATAGAARPLLREVLPSQGAVYVERTLSEVLCKPKILPIKSVALEKVEQIERESAQQARAKRVGTSRG